MFGNYKSVKHSLFVIVYLQMQVMFFCFCFVHLVDCSRIGSAEFYQLLKVKVLCTYHMRNVDSSARL